MPTEAPFQFIWTILNPSKQHSSNCPSLPKNWQASCRLSTGAIVEERTDQRAEQPEQPILNCSLWYSFGSWNHISQNFLIFYKLKMKRYSPSGTIQQNPPCCRCSPPFPGDCKRVRSMRSWSWSESAWDTVAWVAQGQMKDWRLGHASKCFKMHQAKAKNTKHCGDRRWQKMTEAIVDLKWFEEIVEGSGRISWVCPGSPRFFLSALTLFREDGLASHWKTRHFYWIAFDMEESNFATYLHKRNTASCTSPFRLGSRADMTVEISQYQSSSKEETEKRKNRALHLPSIFSSNRWIQLDFPSALHSTKVLACRLSSETVDSVDVEVPEGWKCIGTRLTFQAMLPCLDVFSKSKSLFIAWPKTI